MPENDSSQTEEELRIEFAKKTADFDFHKQNLVGYVGKWHRSEKNPDVRYLLQSYQKLVKEYYKYYQKSLLEKWLSLNRDRQAFQLALDQVQDQTVKAALNNRLTEIGLELSDLKENTPILMQSTLSKLAAEWSRVYQVVAASRASQQKNRTIMAAMTPVLKAAARSTGIPIDRIILLPQVGGDLSLSFFNYAPELIILHIPVFTLNAPWEWSVFWHELAGYRIRQLERYEFEAIKQRVADVKQSLRHASTILRRLEAEATLKPNLLQDPLKEGLVANVESLIDDMVKLAAASTGLPTAGLHHFLNGDEAGSQNILDFGEQFQLIKDALWQRGVTDYEAAMAAGWNQDWLRELFEDAFSTRFFQDPFPPVLQRILERFPDGGKGSDHPPRNIRDLVAKQLLNGATFLADDTPGESLTRVGRIQNTGWNSWGTGYRLVCIQGQEFVEPAEQSLPSIHPGEEATVTLQLKAVPAPEQPVPTWQFQDNQGKPFGDIICINEENLLVVGKGPLQLFLCQLVASQIRASLSMLDATHTETELAHLKDRTGLFGSWKPYWSQYQLRRDGLQLGPATPDLTMAPRLGKRKPTFQPFDFSIPVRPTDDELNLAQYYWQERPGIAGQAAPADQEQGLELDAIRNIIGTAMNQWIDNDEVPLKVIYQQLKDVSPNPTTGRFRSHPPQQPDGLGLKRWFQDKAYTELAALDFQEIDFLTGPISNVTLKVGTKTETMYTMVEPPGSYRLPTDDSKGKVSYTHAGTPHTTNERAWNEFFPSSKIPPSR